MHVGRTLRQRTPASTPGERLYIAGIASIPVVPFESSQLRLLSQHGLLVPLLRNVIVAEAVADTALSDEERQQALGLWAQRHGVSNQEELTAFLHNHAMTQEEASFQAELPMRVDRHALASYSHRAEQRFLQRKTELDQVVYSLIRVQDSGLAQELYLRISEGEATFADLAAEHSMGHEKASRGIVGPVPLTQAHPRLVELLRTGNPGQLYPPMAIEQWWLIVRLEELQPATFDDTTQVAMVRELFNEEVAEQLRQRLAELRPSTEPVAA